MRIKFSYARVGGEPTDLVATVDATVTVGDLAAALDRTDPLGHRGEIAVNEGSRLSLRVHPTAGGGNGTVLPADTDLVSSGLRSGASISLAAVADRYQTAGATRGPAAATLRVLTGPDAGREFSLAEGSSFLGRDAGCDVKLSDGLVSKRHARINVSDVVEIVDTGSANGLIIGGSQVARAVLRPQDRVIVGDTSISVISHRSVAASLAQTTDVDFNRSPRLDPTFEGELFTAPEPPERLRPARFPVIAMVAPLVMGAVLFAVTRSLLSIVFIGLSPLLMIGTYVDNRIQNKRQMRDAVEQFNESIHVMRQDIAGALAKEQSGRLAESPATADAMDAIARQTPLLWTRRAEHDRFLTARLGTGAQPSRHQVDLPGQNKTAAEHWRALTSLKADAAIVQGVPVVADLRDCGAVGIAGSREAAAGVARGVVCQFLSLHSPADLSVMAIASPDSAADWSWLTWVPHVGSPHSPVPGAQLSSDGALGVQIAAELEELIAVRSANPPANVGERTPVLPSVLVIIEDDAPVERARLVGVAEAGRAAGVYILWVAGSQERLPAVCRTYVSVDNTSGEVTAGYVKTAMGVAPVVCETVDVARASMAARSLAPVVDAGVRVEDDSDLPRSTSFLTLIGPELADQPAAVLERWRESLSIIPRDGSPPVKRRNTTLRAVVGQAAGETLTLDLHTQGPHALVGGTTGAGKSEFLQSWVLGMAAGYSPDVLTFLYVDYKGGAAFADCIELPHTVGLVTDLSPHLVRRALTSLNAELRYREHILNAKKAKDLVELQRRGDPDAPPRLIIVVDEFAALVHEVPEFVDGVVNIAQRGRSLGLHLILATQRPAGVIKDNLRANTNLRIALRMADESDSTDVLGVPVAAGFSPEIPGRGAAKTGPGRIAGFQTGYAGGWTTGEAPPAQLDISELKFGLGRRWEEPESGGAQREDDLGPTDIVRLVASISAAAQVAQIPQPRKPWLPELSRIYDWQFLNQRRDTELAIGVADNPKDQRQETVYFHPDVEGNMAVFGTGGSGKSTVLRTVAIAAGVTPRSGPCHVYGLDFGSSGLRMLETLPHVGSIISGDDDERIVRLIRWLRAEVDERAVKFAAVRAGSLTDYRSLADRPDEPRIFLLLDGISAFREAYEGNVRDGVYIGLQQIAADGRPLGVHVILTADRFGAVPSSLAASMQRRLVLRMSDESDYAFLNIESDILSQTSPPGRGVLDGQELQIAVLGGSSTIPTQSREVDKLAVTLARVHRSPAQPILSLPIRVALSELSFTVAGLPAIGIGGEQISPVGVELTGAFLVSGPPQSGRTTALVSLATAIRRARPDLEFSYFGNRRSPLPGLVSWQRVCVQEEDIIEQAKALTEQINSGADTLRKVIVIESLSENVGTQGEKPLSLLIEACRRHGQFIIGESEISTMSGFSDLLKFFKADRRGLLLQPESGDGDTMLRTPLPRIKRSEFPQGRGFIIGGGQAVRTQIALPE